MRELVRNNDDLIVFDLKVGKSPYQTFSLKNTPVVNTLGEQTKPVYVCVTAKSKSTAGAAKSSTILVLKSM